MNALEDRLYQVFGNQIEVIGKKDSDYTHRFEVTIVPINKLIHSKATRGQKFCNSLEEQTAVINEIQNYLNSLTP